MRAAGKAGPGGHSRPETPAALPETQSEADSSPPRSRARPCGSANEAVWREPVPEGRENSRQTASIAVLVAPRGCGGLEGAGVATGFPLLSLGGPTCKLGLPGKEQ